MSLVLNNTQITVSPARLEYNKIRLKFLSHALAAADDFSRSYESRFKNLDDLRNHGNDAAYSYIRKAVEVAIQELVDRGIYDVDSDALLEYLDPYFTWPDDFADIENAYAEIVANAEALDEHRVNRRQSRGRFIGGGFGLTGVAKGVITAGAANVLFGTGHRIANGVGKIISSGLDAEKKNAIFTAPTTKQQLVAGVHRAVFNVHFSLIDAANDKRTGSFSDLVTEEAHDKASRLLQNVAARRLPKDVVPIVLTEALHLDPYNEELYSLWFDQLGDQDGQLESVEKFFGIDVILRTKRDLIAARKSSLNLSTPEACKESLVSLSNYAKSIDYQHFAAEQADILAIADRLDRERRTVEGKEYSTLAQADDAREALRLEIIRRDNSLTSSGMDIFKAVLGGFLFLAAVGGMIGQGPFLMIAVCAALAIACFQNIRSIRIMKLVNGIGCAIAAIAVLFFVSEVAANLTAKESVSMSAFGGVALCIAAGWGIGKLMRKRHQEAGHGDFKQYFTHSLIGGTIIGAVLGVAIAIFAPEVTPEVNAAPSVSAMPEPAITAAVLAPTSSTAATAHRLPFVGRRTFNFDGGNGTEQSITISPDGNTRVEYLGSTDISVEFDDKFTNPLSLKEGQALLFIGNAVYATKDGKVQKGCRNEHLECAVELFDPAAAQAQPSEPLSLQTALADGKSVVCLLDSTGVMCVDPQVQNGKTYLPEDYLVSKGYTVMLAQEMFTEPGTADSYIKFKVKP